MVRRYKRDALGRFTSAGSVAGATAGAALGSKAARRRYVPGSLKSESHIGTSADGKFVGAKIGARYTAPGGREVVVKGIVGISQPKKQSPTTASASAAAKATRQSAASASGRATGGRASVGNSGATQRAGRKLRR